MVNNQKREYLFDKETGNSTMEDAEKSPLIEKYAKFPSYDSNSELGTNDTGSDNGSVESGDASSPRTGDIPDTSSQSSSQNSSVKLNLKTPKLKLPYVEHKYTFQEISSIFSTQIDYENPALSRGLDPHLAETLLQTEGPNILTPPAKSPLWLLFLMQFTNLFMVLLLVASGLCMVIFIVYPDDFSNLWLSLFLLVVVIVTCYESYAQEAKSDELMAKFKELVPEDATVIREGIPRPVPVHQLVLGDIIRLKAGDKVPADCRVIFNAGLLIDQSIMMGEADPVQISVWPQNDAPLESKNIIFNGSLVVDGSGLAVVIRTGDCTYIGTLVELTADTAGNETNLKKDIDSFVMLIAVFSLVQATLVFIIGVARGMPILDTFIQGFVVIIVANIPQGLPSTVTACLYIIAERMAAEQVFVKKLDVIETLGACSLICTDKTGTLTLNSMHVSNIWFYCHKLNAKEFEDTNRQVAIFLTLTALIL